MPIFQTNLWTCELCGEYVSTVDLVRAGERVPVLPLKEQGAWGYIEVGNEQVLACPECLEQTAERPKDSS